MTTIAEIRRIPVSPRTPGDRARPQALARAGGHRHRPADDRARRLDREHRPALGPAGACTSPPPTASGSSPPTRSPSAACCCSAAGSPTTWAASACSSSACSASPPRPRSAGWRPDAPMLFGARALQGAFAALHGPGRAVPDHRDLHRGQGAGHGVRRLRRHLRRRRGDRPDPRRRAHRVRLVALVPAGQRADRRWSPRAGRPGRPREPGRRRHALRHPRRRHRHRRPGRPGLRLHQGRRRTAGPLRPP